MPAGTAPFANTTAQWFSDDFDTVMRGVEKIVLHTTETSGWPGYSKGAVAPHWTWRYMGDGERQVRQHFRFDQIARALVNKAGGVQTNADGCIQIELVGTCRDSGGPGLVWPDAPEAVLALLAADLRWLCDEFDLPVQFAPLWLPYPASYGNTKARMSGAGFNAFRGILGHQHVPENSHGDPGDLDVATLKRLMEGDMELGDQIGASKIETGAPLTVGIALDRTYKWVQSLLSDVAALKADVATLKGQPAPSPSGAPVAAVLSEADREDIANRVADKLAARLAD